MKLGSFWKDECPVHFFTAPSPKSCAVHTCFMASPPKSCAVNTFVSGLRLGEVMCTTICFKPFFCTTILRTILRTPSGAPRNKHNYFPGNSCVRNSWPQKIVVRPDAEIVVRSKKLCKNSCAPKLTCARTRKIVVRSKQGCAKICTHN